MLQRVEGNYRPPMFFQFFPSGYSCIGSSVVCAENDFVEIGGKEEYDKRGETEDQRR